MRCGGSCWYYRGRSPPPETMTGKILIILGAVLVVIGVLVQWGPSIPVLRWLGRLPGDIVIERLGFRFYFPLTTMILVSLILTLLLQLLWGR